MAIPHPDTSGRVNLCYHQVVETPQGARSSPSLLQILLAALRELGPQQLGYYVLYQIGLRSGYYRWLKPRLYPIRAKKINLIPARFMPPPDQALLKDVMGKEAQEQLISEAEEVVSGWVRLFGGEPVQLRLNPPEPLRHWTEHERGRDAANIADVKLIWEPARMGWAVLLGRAYALTGDERYPAAFWVYLEEFLRANPAYYGWNWVSAQEAALRLIAMAFSWQVFADSIHSTVERASLLWRTIAEHASRIPPTLSYARAQDNNHLLSEAAGLYTAAMVLPEHPSARHWRRTGWRLFEQGLKDQIAEDGTYIQHSTNYHRLMLQLALWVGKLATLKSEHFSVGITERLAQATRWLVKLLDRQSGCLPNLGPNDGAYLLPLASQSNADFRPVLQTAGDVFLRERLLENGPWDEMSLWLGETPTSPSTADRMQDREPPSLLDGLPPKPDTRLSQTPHTIQSHSGESWTYLRAAHFDGRPGHADQLHVDMWWGGLNLALDPGTYMYNAPPPWENALSGSDVHNTVTVDGLDQMQRVGKFLFLQRAQAKVITNQSGAENSQSSIAAEHDGYKRVGVIHRRILRAGEGECWIVEDELLPLPTTPTNKMTHQACLNWLVPDWEWKIESDQNAYTLILDSTNGPVRLMLSSGNKPGGANSGVDLQIIRAGKSIFGSGSTKLSWGWCSPTYGVKLPALAIRFNQSGELPLQFRSEWRLGRKSNQPCR
jgi:hypothetical protein